MKRFESGTNAFGRVDAGDQGNSSNFSGSYSYAVLKTLHSILIINCWMEIIYGCSHSETRLVRREESPHPGPLPSDGERGECADAGKHKRLIFDRGPLSCGVEQPQFVGDYFGQPYLLISK